MQLVVAVDGDGVVVGCLQLAVLPGISSQAARAACSRTFASQSIAAAAASARSSCSGRSRRRAREVACSSSC
ncbi:hypothetical protein J2R79_007002 [Bradyrhizobium sp. USDA 4539]|nr:hypothetical protein [Bradyrhizobium sp. USDA 4539]